MLYRFGDLEFDDGRAVLTRRGRTVEIAPKPLALLAELLRRSPNVVATEDILSRIWPDAVVTKASVARAVRGLRRALGESASEATVIRSVRGRGYSIAIDVERERTEQLEPLSEWVADDQPMVGRLEPRRQIGDWLRSAASGRGKVATIVGEPGIGKTLLAEAAQAQAEQSGFVVAVGRATDDTGAPALRPFVDILRAVRGELPTDVFDRAAMPDAALLSRIAPDLFGDSSFDRHLDPIDEEHAPHHALDAVERLLGRLASHRPMLLVVDDLQWADAATCEVFERLARSIDSCAILVIGCHRTPDPEPSSGESQQPFARLSERLLVGFAAVAPPIELDGLDADELAEIAEREMGTVLGDPARKALRDRSGGNPFFAIELAKSGALDDSKGASAMITSHRLPVQIRAVVRSRVQGLSSGARELLRAAAVLGEPFRLSLMARLLDRPENELLPLLDDLDRAALIREGRERSGTYSFVHALVGEAIVETLSRSGRVGMNGRIARALESLHANRSDAPVHVIAHHYALAVAGGGDLDRAIDWAWRAGDRARAQLLFGDAVTHYRRAHEWVRDDPSRDPVDAIELLLAIGRSELGHGEPKRANECFWEACDLALGTGRIDLLAAAAWPLAASQYRGEGAERIQTLLESGLAAVAAKGGAADAATTAQLHASLARAQSYTKPFERVDVTARRAVELARESDDLVCELKALATRDLVLSAEPLFEERAIISRDRIGLSIEIGHRGHELMARIYRIIRLIQQADAQAIDREIEICERLTVDSSSLTRGRAYVLDARVLRCCWRGEIAEADELMPQLQALMSDVDPAYSMMSLGAKSTLIDRLAGRNGAVDDDELRSALGGGQFALPRPYVCSIAVRLHEQGREDEARESFGYLSRLDYADLQRDVTYLVTVVQLAELAHRFEDKRRAALLQPLLDPFEGCYSAGHTAAIRGAVDRYRGLLAWTLGDLDAADSLLAASIEVEANMDAAPWEAMARADRARLLLDRGGDERRGLARRELDLADEALARRDTPGMNAFVSTQRARF